MSSLLMFWGIFKRVHLLRDGNFYRNNVLLLQVTVLFWCNLCIFFFFLFFFHCFSRCRKEKKSLLILMLGENYFQVHFLWLCCDRICAMTCTPREKSALLMDSSVFACIAFLNLACAQWQNSVKWQKSQQTDLPHEARKTAVILSHVTSVILISESCIKN